MFLTIAIVVEFLFSYEKNEFRIGIELSELMQNSFRNIGPSNITFYSGLNLKNPVKYDFSFIYINVQLDSMHLKTNNFIEGDKENLKGTLISTRFYYDFSVHPFKKSFIKIKPVLGLGAGFTDMEIWKNTTKKAVPEEEKYISKSFSLNIFPRIRTYLFEYFFIEFPSSDIFINLWTNKDKVKEFDGTKVTFPDYGGIFLWINTGLSFNF